METLWFGIKMGVGIAAGLTIFFIVVRVFNGIRARITVLRFARAGFTYENNLQVSGWLTRDPHNDDWIIWDDKHNVMLRSADEDAAWRTTNESMHQCLALGRGYQKRISQNR